MQGVLLHATLALQSCRHSIRLLRVLENHPGAFAPPLLQKEGSFFVARSINHEITPVSNPPNPPSGWNSRRVWARIAANVSVHAFFGLRELLFDFDCLAVLISSPPAPAGLRIFVRRVG